MQFFEECVERQTLYEGMIINVRRDRARLHTGTLVKREVVEHPGGVVVIAVTDAGDVLAVRQYRYPVGEELLELPAGKLERGEDPLESAKREFSEETGYTADTWTSLGFIYPSPGYSEERLYMFLATGLVPGTPHPDEDEFLTISEVSFEEFWDKITNGTLRDAKTIAGIAMAERYLNGKG